MAEAGRNALTTNQSRAPADHLIVQVSVPIMRKIAEDTSNELRMVLACSKHCAQKSQQKSGRK